MQGSNIAMMVELLGSALVGTHLAVDHPPGHPFDEINRGLFVVAIDRGTFSPFGAHDGDSMFSAVMGSSDNARLPSERRYAHRKRVEEGMLIDVPEATYNKCVLLAGEKADGGAEEK